MSLYEIYVIHATKHIRQRQTVSNWPVENFVIAVDVKPEVNSGDGLIISVDVVCYQVPGVRVCHLSVLLFVIPAPLTHCIADTQCPQTPHVHISTPCSNHHGQFVGTRSVVSCLLWPERCTGASSCGKIKSLNVWQTWDRNPSSVVRHMHKVYFSPFWDVLPHSDMTTSSIVCQCTTYITTSHSCSQTAEFIEPEQQPLKRLIASNRNNSHWRDWSHRTRTTATEETDCIEPEQQPLKRLIASNQNNGRRRDRSHQTGTTDAEETDRIEPEQQPPKRPIASNRNNGRRRDRSHRTGTTATEETDHNTISMTSSPLWSLRLGIR